MWSRAYGKHSLSRHCWSTHLELFTAVLCVAMEPFSVNENVTENRARGNNWKGGKGRKKREKRESR